MSDCSAFEQERDSIISAMSDILFVVDENFFVRRIFTADQAYRHFALENIVGKNLWEIFSEDFIVEQQKVFERVKGTGSLQTVTFPSDLYESGRWYEARITHHIWEGSGHYVVGMTDITFTRQLSKEVEELSAEINNFFSMELVLFAVIDLQGNLKRVNKAWEGLLGYPVDELTTKSFEELIHPDDLKNTQRKAKQLMDKQTIIHITNRFRAKDGTYKYLEWHSKLDGDLIYSSVRDVTEGIQRQEEIEFLDFHDQQTGLFNRKALRTMGDEIVRTSREGLRWGAYFIDIDNYSAVNNALGHAEGDRILVQIADSIARHFEEEGISYRYEGDEFVVLSRSGGTEEMIAHAKKLLSSIPTRITLTQRVFMITVSIGIALGAEGERINGVIEKAQTALFKAKLVRNTYAVYEPRLELNRTREMILAEDFPRALEREQLRIELQPILDVKKGIVCQAEALLRWHHPEFGEISPVEFIPIAEATKLIVPITEWIVRQVCAMLLRIDTHPEHRLTIAINLSAISLENQGGVFFERVREIIETTGVEASQLKFEITESTLITDYLGIMDTFNELKKLGVKFALDDFGTGYSSFAYLKELPFDAIKIDRSLISSLNRDSKEQILVRSLIAIIHSLAYEVVVEGVETPEQYELLKEYGSDYVQGFLFSRSLGEDAFVEYYREAL